MPRDRSAGLVEEVGLGRAGFAKPVDEPVVRLDEPDLHLAHEDMGVVARVTDEGDSLLIPRQVAAVFQELRGVVSAIHVRRPRRPSAVERFEVRTRDAHVAESPQVGVRANGRAIRGQVMRHVLPEEGPAGLDCGVDFLLAIAETPECTELREELLVSIERGQVEHPPVSRTCIDGFVDPIGRRTEISGAVGDHGACR